MWIVSQHWFPECLKKIIYTAAALLFRERRRIGWMIHGWRDVGWCGEWIRKIYYSHEATECHCLHWFGDGPFVTFCFYISLCFIRIMLQCYKYRSDATSRAPKQSNQQWLKVSMILLLVVILDICCIQIHRSFCCEMSQHYHFADNSTGTA